MSVYYKPSYTLPVSDYPLKHARVLHAGNWKTNSSVTTSVAAADGFFSDAITNSLTYEKFKQTSGTGAYMEWDTGSVSSVDCICIGAHTLGTAAATITIISSASSSMTSPTTHLSAQSITDDSPIMVITEPITHRYWRITWTATSAPTIGVARVGLLLQMARPFYGDFAKSRMNRTTLVRGNTSEGGEFLGRTKVRTGSTAQYHWQHLDGAWCDTNLPSLILNLESEPFFLAWRPGETSDVDFAWTNQPPDNPPRNMGIRDLREFGFGAQVYGYE